VAYDTICIVIPAFHPNEQLPAFCAQLRAGGFSHIVLIDDGNPPSYAGIFEEAERQGCAVLHHEGNRGKGAALKTAFAYIRGALPACVGVVTADADGQHLAADIALCADELLANPGALVLGSRDFTAPQVPSRSRAGNGAASSAFWLFCGRRVIDTQTGLRGVPAALLPRLLKTHGSRFDYETNMLIDCAAARVPFRCPSISTVYVGDNPSHFRTLSDTFYVFMCFVRHLLPSMAAFVLDFLLFWLFYVLLQHVPLGLFIAAAAARIVSAPVWHLLRRERDWARTLSLSLGGMLVSAVVMYLLHQWVGLSPLLVKPFIDVLIFFVVVHFP